MPKLTSRISLLRQPLAWLLLLALAIRLFQLTYHNLWFDEVMSCFWAAKPAAEIWRTGLSLTQDKHPPLYYLMLHFWSGLFGDGDAAVRSLGALLGALAVLPTYGIGLRLGNRRTAGLSALFVALSPFLVWYSQEARMFMPATTFALVGLYGILLIADDPPLATRSTGFTDAGGEQRSDGRQRNLIVASICIVSGFTGALYTYLFSAFLLPVAGAWVLLLGWSGRRSPDSRRAMWIGLAALAAVAGLFAPLALSAWRVSGGESMPGTAFGGMGPALWRLLRVYTLGWPQWASAVSTALTGLLGLVALIGIATPLDRGSATRKSLRGSTPSILLACWFGLPLLTGGLLLARDATVFAETRYFIFLAPPLCIAWGRALGWRPPAHRTGGRTGLPWMSILGLAIITGCLVAALPYNWAPENRKEAWREAAGLVAELAGPNDAILIDADYVHIAFERYFHGSQDIFFPFTDALSSPTQVDPPLEGMTGYDSVWVIQSHNQDLDPGNLILEWYGARYPLITEAYPAGIAIHGYAQRYRLDTAPSGSSSSSGGFIEHLHLDACDFEPSSLHAHDSLYHPPSGWVHVTSFWSSLDQQAADRHPTIQLIDEAGQVWGQSLERSNDALQIWPTSRWLPDEYVRLDQDVNLNPITPPGEYRLRIQVPGLPGEAWCGGVTVH